jgi:hypothetical protein
MKNTLKAVATRETRTHILKLEKNEKHKTRTEQQEDESIMTTPSSSVSSSESLPSSSFTASSSSFLSSAQHLTNKSVKVKLHQQLTRDL